MSIIAQGSQVEYSGNASTSTPYPIPFRYDDSSWVTVEVIDALYVVTELEHGEDYTLTGNGGASNGNVVTTGGAVPAASKLRITRTTPLTQGNSIVPNGQIPTNTIVSSFDKLTMALQDIRSRIDQLEERCYRVPDGRHVEAGALAFQIGTVTHLAAGQTPTATISGPGPAFTLNFGLPTGATGGLAIGPDASFGTTPNLEGGPALTLWDQGTQEYRAIGLEHGTFVVLTYP
jgi:hypothetical protein